MATGYRARLKQRRVNRKNSDVGDADDLLPSSRFQKFAHSPRIRSSIAAPSNIPIEFLRENFNSPRHSYMKSKRYRPKLTLDPTKVAFDDRKISPIIARHVYTLGTTTANIPWTAAQVDLDEDEKDDDALNSSMIANFVLGGSESRNRLSPKTNKIRQSTKIFQHSISPTKPESTDRIPVIFVASDKSVVPPTSPIQTVSTRMVKRTDNWPTCRPIGTVSINGLHNTGKHHSQKEEMLRGHLHGDTLTGGYTVSKDPIDTYRSKVQTDYVWPTVYESEWRRQHAGGRPCLFAAENMQGGFRGGDSKSDEIVMSGRNGMAGGGGGGNETNSSGNGCDVGSNADGFGDGFCDGSSSSSSRGESRATNGSSSGSGRSGERKGRKGRNVIKSGYHAPTGVLKVKDHADQSLLDAMNGHDVNYAYQNTHQVYKHMDHKKNKKIRL